MKIFFWRKKRPTPQVPKSKKKEWMDAILFAIIAATIIRWATFEAFAIPTPSMEGSLLVGDYLFVSKLHYGARTPKTLLQLPLMHQKLLGTEIPSFSSLIQIPQFRLPGFQKIKNNDNVVFNYPEEIQYPLDQKTYYVKRCIGISGDTVHLRDMKVFVNGKHVPDPIHTQYSYLLESENSLNKKFFEKYNLYQPYGGPQRYLIHTTPSIAKEISSLPYIKNITLWKEQAGRGEKGVVGAEIFGWNKDNFGPLYIPQKGSTILVNSNNLNIYGKYIERYEHHKKVLIETGKLYIDDSLVTNYTFKQNYYFMMGDNRHNSEDSRFWGLVPEDHILGKPVLVWMSSDPDKNYFDIVDKIRWNRIFSIIE